MATQNGHYAVEQPLVADNLEILPGSCNESVVAGIRRFWNSRDLYKKHGLSYKRGVLFYGAPGAGKTATILLLCKELITNYSGAVFLCQQPQVLAELLKKLRRIEPDRPLIVVMEDLDEIIAGQGEHSILALLDGEEQIDNVVFLASTNYPERLGARIVNRPSRFDERIFVDMPSEITRRAYLEIVSKSDPLPEKELAQWVLDTNRMSIAHLRELVIAVRCLGHSYDDVITPKWIPIHQNTSSDSICRFPRPRRNRDSRDARQ
jgi:AAA+ superfamily predicted ATPase